MYALHTVINFNKINRLTLLYINAQNRLTKINASLLLLYGVLLEKKESLVLMYSLEFSASLHIFHQYVKQHCLSLRFPVLGKAHNDVFSVFALGWLTNDSFKEASVTNA